jgi:hypothetical protein
MTIIGFRKGKFDLSTIQGIEAGRVTATIRKAQVRREQELDGPGLTIPNSFQQGQAVHVRQRVFSEDQVESIA